MHTYIHIYIYVVTFYRNIHYVNICLHSWTHVYIYICINIYIYIHTYIYTRVGLSLLSDIVSGPYHLAIGPKVEGQPLLAMHFIFYIVDGWSFEKLTGSIYSLCTFSSTFSIDAGS